jgi:hypothetical protein
VLHRTQSNLRVAGFSLLVTAALTLAAAVGTAQSAYNLGPVWWNAGEGGRLPWEETYENPDGAVSIFNKNGLVHTDNHPFFESLGTNRRACVTCHQPSNGMGISAATLRERWSATEGRDPVFAAIDGSNCPDLPQNAAASHSLLLDRGLFRIILPWPPKPADGPVLRPEFRIEVVRDPTGCNKSGSPVISVFRRPRIAANLEFVLAQPDGNTLMADGREPSLRAQAVSAIMAHEQAAHPPTADQLRQIVDFEMQVYAAQSSDIRGGRLTDQNGPIVLGTNNLAGGKAGSLGRDAAEPVIQSFNVWRKAKGGPDLGLQWEFRASVARGSDLFFKRGFRIRAASNSVGTYTCATCHSGGINQWMDIGTTSVSPEKALSEKAPQLPLFRITCDASAMPHPVLGRVFFTHDPGRGLVTGKCADVGSIVPQQLRALAARAPYFSNGSAQTLREVIEYYDRCFDIGYTEQEKQDLTNFLRVL